jgi:23S rRNA pseudouridine2457 synthase
MAADRPGEGIRPSRRGATTLLFHKPYGVLSQFTPEPGSPWDCLASWVDVRGVYPAGRLDADSEGLLILTGDGRLQHRLTDPRWGHWRRYHVQVEGIPLEDALERLRRGVPVAGRMSRPARVRAIPDPGLAERRPPIRYRRTVPTRWLELELREGRNRQVRRMTAAVGFPTLRLVRVGIDLMDAGPALCLEGLEPGRWRPVSGQERRRLEALLHSGPTRDRGFSRSHR